MGKFSRFKYGVANERGTAITKTSAYDITEKDILRIGQFFHTLRIVAWRVGLGF